MSSKQKKIKKNKIKPRKGWATLGECTCKDCIIEFNQINDVYLNKPLFSNKKIIPVRITPIIPKHK